MAELEPVESPTVTAYYAGLVAAEVRDDFHPRLSASSLGDECSAKLWHAFRWTHAPEVFDGRKLSIFTTGNVWEDRLVTNLRAAGMEVEAFDIATGEQFRIVFAGGHASGRTDGKILGVVEAPKTWHVLECKSHNHKSFTALKREKVEKSKPSHFAQMQTYMHHQGLTRALYVAVNKNDDEVYIERIDYRLDVALDLVAKAERIVTADRPPPRLHDDPSAKMAWQCKFCPALAVCHEGAFARSHCRTCLHATAEMDGDGRWTCARWAKDLSLDEQKAGCPNHLFIPDLVPGEQIDADEAAETITYRMADGSTWVDGGRVAE